MRVAVVHDWLYVVGGAERVLREILRCYPDADVYALFDVLTDEERAWIGYSQSRTSFLQRIKGIDKIHRSLLPLMPLAIEQFDFSDYDLVISSSYAVAKGVITGPDQVHIAYVHTPMRYAWDLQHQYLRESSGFLGLKRAFARLFLHPIRLWDASSGLRPDAVIANSAFVSRRIKKAFGRKAHVIHPPVAILPPSAPTVRGDHFLAAGRLVSYKNTRAIVEAFKLLPDLNLIVAGSGPDTKLLQSIAGPNVTFAGFVDNEEMRRLMATARALILAAEEDFGIVPLESQAEGTPVLALGRGGVRESVIASGSAPTGMFFEESTPIHIAACVNAFIAREASFTREACRKQAQLFSEERFRSQFKMFVEGEMKRLRAEISAANAAERLPLQRAAAE